MMKEGQKQRIYSSRRKEKEREENTKGNWVRRELGKRKKKTRKSRSLKLLSQKWRNSEKKSAHLWPTLLEYKSSKRTP